MAEESKWTKTLAGLNPVQEVAGTALTPILPAKAPLPLGKRSTPGWKQKSVLLKEESIYFASERLRRRGDRTDFSDLMQALLDAWLATPE